jgi:hypothetical protein
VGLPDVDVGERDQSTALLDKDGGFLVEQAGDEPACLMEKYL